MLPTHQFPPDYLSVSGVCREAAAFVLLLVLTLFESLRSMVAMTQVRGSSTPDSRPFPNPRVVSVCCFGGSGTR